MKKRKRNKKYIIAGFLLLLVIMFMGASYALKGEKKEESLQENTVSVEERNLLIASLPSGQGTTYFFRGTHTLNNNVIWAGYQWKILRVEPNGTVRMIYNGVCTLNPAKTNCTEGINGASSGANALLLPSGEYSATLTFDTNRNIGYIYGDNNSSTIKGRVDLFYENLSLNARAQTVPTTFCNDRSIYSQTSSETVYGAYDRVEANTSPSLTCQEEDRFTLNVGLITADEVVMAGGRGNQNVTNFFLNIGASFWTMTPGSICSSCQPMGRTGTFGYILDSSGRLKTTTFGHAYDTGEHGVRPVLSLNSNVKISGGDGSVLSPFIVQT